MKSKLTLFDWIRPLDRKPPVLARTDERGRIRPVARATLMITALAVNVLLTAQEPPSDPFVDLLCPPELVMQFQDAIGLTDAQKKSVVSTVDEVGPKFSEKQRKLQEEIQAMASLLKQGKVDEAKALAQLDTILDREREIKRLQWSLMIRVRNQLTTEQQAKLRELKAQIPPPGPERERLEQRLRSKVEKIQQAVQKLVDDGSNPSDIAEMMHGFEPLMKSGKIKDAEALVDRVLKQLEEKRKQGAVIENKKAKALIQGTLRSLDEVDAVRRLTTPEQLETEIKALRDPNVAWRGIEWESCLLEGLRASREQNKPLLLWVFIDRPADDQRC